MREQLASVRDERLKAVVDKVRGWLPMPHATQ
jgi:hypothetical protein